MGFLHRVAAEHKDGGSSSVTSKVVDFQYYTYTHTHTQTRFHVHYNGASFQYCQTAAVDSLIFTFYYFLNNALQYYVNKKTIFAYGMNDKNKQKHLPIIQKKRKTSAYADN